MNNLFGLELLPTKDFSRYSPLLITAKQILEEKCQRFLPEQIKIQLLEGDLTTTIQKSSKRVQIFISSTFEDTKFEQDAFLIRVFPFLSEYCAILSLEFNVVSMRWGVRNRSGNDHRTSELCMAQLHKCHELSCGVSYVTLQSHRYGYRPFPSMIRKDVFESIRNYLEKIDHSDINLLQAPYWILDETADPPYYQLQPISTLPGLIDYLLTDLDKEKMKLDQILKADLLSRQRKAGGEWWKIFEKMQIAFQLGAKSSPNLNEEDRSAFFISVTHDEVNRGLLKNPNAGHQAIYFERLIEGIDDALRGSDPLTCSTAAAYKDALWAPYGTAPREKNEETEKLEDDLKFEIRNTLSEINPSRIHQFVVPFVSGDALDKKQPKEPPEWEEYITALCDVFVKDVCSQLRLSYLPPISDPLLNEILHHQQIAKLKLSSPGFDRIDLVNQVMDYLISDLPPPDVQSEIQVEGNDGKKYAKNVSSLILYGESGTGKSWLMSQFIHEIKARLGEDVIVLYRFLGTTSHSSDALELIRNIFLQISQLTEKNNHINNNDTNNNNNSNGESTSSSLQDFPVVWSEASQYFAEGKFWPSSEQVSHKKIVLFLDSIDQLSQLHAALRRLSSWLPGLAFPLPPHVRVVISMLPQDKGCHLLSQVRQFLPELSLSQLTSTHPSWAGGIKEVSQIHQNHNSSAMEEHQRNESLEIAIHKMFSALPPRGVILPYNRLLSEPVQNLLQQCFQQHPNPLFLSIAISIVSKWPSYYFTEMFTTPSTSSGSSLHLDAHTINGESNMMIDRFKVSCQEGIRGLISFIFRQLEETHGCLLVRKVLSLITVASEGLSLGEIEDIISCDDLLLDDIFEWWVPPFRRIPPMLVDRIFSDIQEFIVIRGTSTLPYDLSTTTTSATSNGSVLAYIWYHRQFWETVEDLYLSQQQQLESIHTSIAHYFEGDTHFRDRMINLQPLRIGQEGNEHKSLISENIHSSGLGRINLRKIVEWPHSLLRSGPSGVHRMALLFTSDLDFLVSCVEAGQFSTLMEQIQSLLRLIPSIPSHFQKIQVPTLHLKFIYHEKRKQIEEGEDDSSSLSAQEIIVYSDEILQALKLLHQTFLLIYPTWLKKDSKDGNGTILFKQISPFIASRHLPFQLISRLSMLLEKEKENEKEKALNSVLSSSFSSPNDPIHNFNPTYSNSDIITPRIVSLASHPTPTPAPTTPTTTPSPTPTTPTTTTPTTTPDIIPTQSSPSTDNKKLSTNDDKNIKLGRNQMETDDEDFIQLHTPPTFTGWIVKAGRKKNIFGATSWKHRFFILVGGTLKYYSKVDPFTLNGGKDLRGSLDLKGFTLKSTDLKYDYYLLLQSPHSPSQDLLFDIRIPEVTSSSSTTSSRPLSASAQEKQAQWKEAWIYFLNKHINFANKSHLAPDISHTTSIPISPPSSPPSSSSSSSSSSPPSPPLFPPPSTLPPSSSSSSSSLNESDLIPHEFTQIALPTTLNLHPPYPPPPPSEVVWNFLDLLSSLVNQSKYFITHCASIPLPFQKTEGTSPPSTSSLSFFPLNVHFEPPGGDTEMTIQTENGIFSICSLNRSLLYPTASTSSTYPYLVTGSTNGEVKVWEPLSGECLFSFIGKTGWVKGICILPPLLTSSYPTTSASIPTSLSKSRVRILSGCMDGSLQVWGIESGICEFEIKKPSIGAVYSLCTLQPHLIAVGDQHGISIWDFNPSSYLESSSSPSKSMEELYVKCEGRLIIEDEKKRRKLAFLQYQQSQKETQLLMNPNIGEHLNETLTDDTNNLLPFIKIGSPEKVSAMSTLLFPQPSITTAEQHTSPIFLASTTRDKIYVWMGEKKKQMTDIEEETENEVLDEKTQEMNAMCWKWGWVGELIGHEYDVISLDSLSSPPIISSSTQTPSTTSSVWLASGSEDKSIRIWELNYQTNLTQEEKVEDCPWYEIDEKNWQGGVGVGVRGVVTGTCLFLLNQHTMMVSAVRFIPYHSESDNLTSLFLLSGSGDQTVCIWKWKNGGNGNERIQETESNFVLDRILNGHERWINCLVSLSVPSPTSPSPYPFTFVSGSLDASLRIWKIKDTICEPPTDHMVEQHKSEVISLLPIPDPNPPLSGCSYIPFNQFITASVNGICIVWNLRDLQTTKNNEEKSIEGSLVNVCGHCVGMLSGHTKKITVLEFLSPNIPSKYFSTEQDQQQQFTTLVYTESPPVPFGDGTCRIWELSTYSCLGIYKVQKYSQMNDQEIINEIKTYIIKVYDEPTGVAIPYFPNTQISSQIPLSFEERIQNEKISNIKKNQSDFIQQQAKQFIEMYDGDEIISTCMIEEVEIQNGGDTIHQRTSNVKHKNDKKTNGLLVFGTLKGRVHFLTFSHS